MKFEIKPRWPGAVLFSVKTDSMRLAVELAVKARTDLAGAYLAGANLARADLAGANLARADLARTDLAGANLAGANLVSADLVGANFAGADLAGANLARADLAGANFAGADLAGADLARADGQRLTLIGERPVLTLGPLGSRDATLQAFMADTGVYICAGCFFGCLDAFRAAVATTHGTNKHAQEYAAAIELIEAHARLWTPIRQEAAA